MNTDDRALADLIAELRAACDADDARHDGSLLKGFAHHVKSADLRTILDRLEAFHAKPVVGRWPDRESIADAFLLSPHRVQNGDRQHANPADYIEYIRTYKSASLGEARRVADFVLSLPGALAALQSPPPVVSTPGVNCPNCGHRLPVGYAGPCVACDAPDVPDLNAPPVVEEGRREVVEKLWDEHIRLVGMDDGYAMALGKDKFFDAILALTPVEGVGEGRYRAYRDHVLDVDSHNTFQVVPVNRTDGDSLAISVAEAMNAALSTPVAAQGDVREALEQAREWICKTADKDEDPEQWSIIRTIDLSLATLGAPHEG